MGKPEQKRKSLASSKNVFWSHIGFCMYLLERCAYFSAHTRCAIYRFPGRDRPNTHYSGKRSVGLVSFETLLYLCTHDQSSSLFGSVGTRLQSIFLSAAFTVEHWSAVSVGDYLPLKVTDLYYMVST